MLTRSSYALPVLATATLLLLDPNCPGAWHSPPAASTGQAVWQESPPDVGGFGPPATLSPDDEPLGDPPPPPLSPNRPPVIKNFRHTVAGTLVTFTGKVEDENPGGLTVRFGGPAALGNRATMTDASGNFTLTIDMGNQTGEVWARTADAEGVESGYVYVNVY